jgi:signal transduction histidine kinase
MASVTAYLLLALPPIGSGDVQERLATGLFVLGMLALAVTGSLLAARPRRVMAVLLLGTGLLGLAGRLSVGVALLLHRVGLPGAAWAGWVTNWAWVPGQAAALVLLLRFPSGKLPGPGWRPLEHAIVGWAVVTLVVTALVPGPLGIEALEPTTNPLGVPPLEGLLALVLPALFLAMPLLLVLAVAAPLLRWRRARGAERAQLGWVAGGTALLAVAAPLALVSGSGRILEGLAYLILPAAVVVAIARHRLWDVDLRRRFDRLRRAREEERARLQRDLHDGLGPLIGSISMRAEAARNMLSAGAPTSRIDEVLADIGRDSESAIRELRHAIEELGPSALVDTGLVAALEEHLDGYAEGPVLRLAVVGDPDADLLPDVADAAFRIACESVRNAVRHASATTVDVTVRRLPGWLEVEVHDDGCGLTGPPGVGRGAMRDRAVEVGGHVAVTDDVTGGVRVLARLPVGSPAGAVPR